MFTPVREKWKPERKEFPKYQENRYLHSHAVAILPLVHDEAQEIEALEARAAAFFLKRRAFFFVNISPVLSSSLIGLRPGGYSFAAANLGGHDSFSLSLSSTLFFIPLLQSRHSFILPSVARPLALPGWAPNHMIIIISAHNMRLAEDPSTAVTELTSSTILSDHFKREQWLVAPLQHSKLESVGNYRSAVKFNYSNQWPGLNPRTNRLISQRSLGSSNEECNGKKKGSTLRKPIGQRQHPLHVKIWKRFRLKLNARYSAGFTVARLVRPSSDRPSYIHPSPIRAIYNQTSYVRRVDSLTARRNDNFLVTVANKASRRVGIVPFRNSKLLETWRRSAFCNHVAQFRLLSLRIAFPYVNCTVQHKNFRTHFLVSLCSTAIIERATNTLISRDVFGSVLEETIAGDSNILLLWIEDDVNMIHQRRRLARFPHGKLGNDPARDCARFVCVRGEQFSRYGNFCYYHHWLIDDITKRVLISLSRIARVQYESHLGEPGSILCGAAIGFSNVGIVPDDAAGRRVFSGISRFTRPCNPSLLNTHLASPSSALNNSMLRGENMDVHVSTSAQIVLECDCMIELNVFTTSRPPDLLPSDHELVQRIVSAYLSCTSVYDELTWCQPARTVHIAPACIHSPPCSNSSSVRTELAFGDTPPPCQPRTCFHPKREFLSKASYPLHPIACFRLEGTLPYPCTPYRSSPTKSCLVSCNLLPPPPTPPPQSAFSVNLRTALSNVMHPKIDPRSYTPHSSSPEFVFGYLESCLPMPSTPMPE
ncbi:hypothetical protein PR048_025433 [Dryococelus australis]|uniref:Uncharacterized protein n=1 Tax=Dryococelus australis TaxID=614101 RepID=A0ABQ9GRD9_9NEOP|nr:hypothetical protein PR048_025433 [Dryococelus australis]